MAADRLSKTGTADAGAEVMLDAKVRFMSRAETYPDATRSVTAVETHMSWVFLTEHYVYKLKKPVRYAYLDFSTLEHRRRDCELEVRLNRRLAPEVYLGTVALTRSPHGTLQLGGDGTAVEWLVKMKRLPQARMLDEAIRRDTVAAEDLRRVSELLARFYLRAPAVAMDGAEYRGRLARAARENSAELCDPVHGLPPGQTEHIVQAQLRILEARPELFERRIVEAHGDLRPQHICLTEPPVVIDCLEFRRDFRLLDPLDELAYLAVECERLGAADAGRRLMRRCIEAIGDAPPEALIDFYKSFRACVRARLAVLHTRDDTVRDHPEWLARAAHYLELARRHLPPVR